MRSLRRLRGRIGLIGNRLTRSFAIRRYLDAHQVRMLQLGAGYSQLPGWLCTDVLPRDRQSIFLDATQVFPFTDQTFDYVFSEHMIEHLPRAGGLHMLRECRRVLKPGGILRIATPDLSVVISLYAASDGEATRYIEWMAHRFLDGAEDAKAAIVINHIFHGWGHQFLYDADLLIAALRDCGFVDIRCCAIGDSVHEALRGVESHGMNDPEMVRFETMVFEAQCPFDP
ncbi:MAG: methyltransferase domain-containing protein [Synechococcaceae cyanobacterium]|nr:methyltransferase domain-containing protein [Synechococcaceae cyanobacterium]